MGDFCVFVFAGAFDPVVFVKTRQEATLIVDGCSLEMALGGESEIAADHLVEEMAVVIPEAVVRALPEVCVVFGNNLYTVSADEFE